MTDPGSKLSQKKMKICIRTLSVSSCQIGCLYRQVFAVRLSSVQRPLRRAGAPSHISCEPTSLKIGVNGVIQVPRPTLTLLTMAARIPILQPLSRWMGPT
jgi:hypothetical protein